MDRDSSVNLTSVTPSAPHSPGAGAPPGSDPEGRGSRRPLWAALLNRGVQYALDVVVLVSSFVLAYLLRFDFVLEHVILGGMVVQLPVAVLCQLSALLLTGAYTIIWRYVGLAEVRPFIRAAFWSALVLFGLRYGLPEQFQEWRIPRSIIVVDSILAFGGVLGLRVARRTLYERYEKQSRNGTESRNRKVLLVGAGRAGVLAAKEVSGRGDLGIDVAAFVDDDAQKRGMVVQNIRVAGTTRDIPRLVAELGIDHVIITIAQAKRPQIRRIVEICESIPIRVRIIPGLYEILTGAVEVSRIRDVQIEDLLGREEVHLDEEDLAGFLKGKVVLVTGAGGSIGSELARQVARLRVGRLLLLERAEFALFEIDRELRATHPDLGFESLIGDVADGPRMGEVLERFRPDVVIHAAAHKHVPLMERNPFEAIKNNILATYELAEQVGTVGCEAFIQISTDKAVRPSSIMGASKRVAELLLQDLDRRYPTRFVSVRFGNVLGSAGSVIPIFHEQIRSGGPVTVTHPDMVRYFMTIPEAAQLVLQAGAMGKGGEIFVLDMGEPVRIFDVAVDMIRLSGLKPFEEVDIVFTGVRPGEKLFEELDTIGESIAKTEHPKIFIGKINAYPPDQARQVLERFRALATSGEETEVRRYFNEVLPEARITERVAEE